jgi:hypothetical protein
MRQSVPYVRFEHQAQSGPKDIDLTVEQYQMLKMLYPDVLNAVSNTTKAANQDATLFEVKLSNFTSAKIITLGGKFFVDIRKTPVEGNEQGGAPANKSGISIRADEWEVLVSNLEPLYKAITAGDMNYQLPVGLLPPFRVRELTRGGS